MSNSRLNKLKSGMKMVVKQLWNFHQHVGDSNVENNFVHKLLLTNTQVSNLRKAFANNSSANVKLSTTQLHKIG